jgi:O-acetyl-ADP-ribose deacetylase (regulator of RNase III)
MAYGHKSINVIHRSKLKQVELTLAVGDLFEAKVDAIVNSEQSDFVLANNPETLSGQIRNRYGAAVQDELDASTKGQVLRAGSVLETSGGQDFKRIFHAGFHDPDDWPMLSEEAKDIPYLSTEPSESRGGDYFAAIGSCIAQVLNSAITQKLTSVAFPLIGCGLFGLDEKMLILQRQAHGRRKPQHLASDSRS